MRGDGNPQWAAANEITQKLVHKGNAIAWAMKIADRGWFARVRDERGDWSFGPSRLDRAQKAAEVWLNHGVFELREDERMWLGDCAALL